MIKEIESIIENLPPKTSPNLRWTLESMNSTDIQGKTNSCFNYRGFYEIVGEYPTKLLMSQMQRKSWETLLELTIQKGKNN